MSKSFWKALSVAVLAVVSGCGGDGGASPGYTLSGTISLPETAAVDSDTNVADNAQRRPNNTPGDAQVINTPAYLIGSVNERFTGPPGANYQTGDDFDAYLVELKAGQVIELEFTADTTANDIDLFAYTEDSQGGLEEIGASYGTNRYECLRVVRPGRHYIVVEANRGSSIYNLRIGAPGDGSTCNNTISSLAGIVPGEVVAKAAPGTEGLSAMRAKAVAAGGLTTATSAGDASVPLLLRLPAERAERAAALARLATAGGDPSTGKRLASSAATLSAQQDSFPASVRDVMDTVRYAKQLARTGAYAYAEPNTSAKLNALVGLYPPSDRLYTNQRWHYEMIGLPGAMATLTPLAAQLTTRPIIAVVDSGIVANHPDLAAQITSQASFTNGDTFTTSADDPSRPGDPTGFHGTHVAGTAAAVTFDGVGVAGVAPMAQLMPIRVFAQGSSVSNGNDVANAILFAARLPNRSGQLPARRADVINLSLGSERTCPALYQDVINQAIAAGVVVVAAAGNESATVRNAPSNCTGVISVGAVDARRQKAYYSNTDVGLSIAAPGGDSRASTTGTGLPDEIFSTLGDFNAAGTRVASYGGYQGTSMATPHVSGVIALMRYVNPSITVNQIATLLAQGRLTDDIGAPGRDSSFGWGLVNASKAVNEALSLAQGVTPVPVAGVLVAQPRAVDFGAVRTTAEVDIGFEGDPTGETVTGVTSSSPAVSVALRQFDSTARVWRYTVTVSRTALPVGSTFATLQFTTSAAKQITVSISILKPATPGQSAADFGKLFVLIVNPDNPEASVEAVPVYAVNGKYVWSKSGVTLPRVQIVAGTDIDNDDLLCQRGEACGGYPQFGANLSILEITGDRSGLDFDVTPYGGVGATTASAAGAAPSTYRKAGTRVAP